MPVTWIHEKAEERSCSKNELGYEYIRRFQALVEDNPDGTGVFNAPKQALDGLQDEALMAEIQGGVIDIGSPYPLEQDEEGVAFCRSIVPSSDGRDRRMVNIVIRYASSSATLSGEIVEPATATPDLSLEYSTAVIPYNRDLDGKETLNSAGGPVNPPPEREIIRPKLVIRQSELFDTTELAAQKIWKFTNALNASIYLGAPPQTLRCRVRGQRRFAYGQWIWALVYQLDYREDTWTKDGEYVSRGWSEKLIDDDGDPYLADILDKNGNPLKDQSNLGADGKRLPPGAPLHYITFREYHEEEFGGPAGLNLRI